MLSAMLLLSLSAGTGLPFKAIQLDHDMSMGVDTSQG